MSTVTGNAKVKAAFEGRNQVIEKTGNVNVLECTDFVTGEPVSIPVPQGIFPAELAQQLYKKAKKLRRSTEIMQELCQQVSCIPICSDLRVHLRTVD